jgi:surface protein
MFYSATSLQTVDLTSWNTSRVTDMSGLFFNNKNLSKIYAGNNFKTNSVSNDHLMFYGATPLVGGSGTVYDASQTGKTYARIDGGTSNPGYFTRK